MTRILTGVLTWAIVLGLIQGAQAGVLFYTSRGAWEADVGGTLGTEDFNSFATDTQFRTSSVALNNMTLTGETGNQGAIANKIDTAPFENPKVYTPLDIDGTSFVFGDLASSQEMEFDMTAAVDAWGVDTSGIGNSPTMSTQMLVYDATDTLLGTYLFLPTGGADDLGFIGLRTTGGDVVSRVVFTNSSPFFDFFGLDNIAFRVTGSEVTPLPEPSSVMLLGLGAIGILALRRRQN